MPKFRAVLFDVDNTLLDFLSMKTACCEAAVDEMIKRGLPLERSVALNGFYSALETHGWEHPLIFQKFLAEWNGGKIDYRILANGVVAYRRKQQSSLRPYASVIPTLEKLRARGIALGIVSDAPHPNGWIRLVETELQDYLDVAVYFGDTNFLKPAREPFAEAMRLLQLRPGLQNLQPHQVLMVGDVPERDIIGAQQYGMKACFAAYGNTRNQRAPTADFTITEFSQMERIVL
ncbi:MAG TPA: HAD hydrolase-like protein [Candidatus Nanoarchaeia archaeon]|nr:HAD hydrolase-like protein [Candidatus Nanoarchaeia archaeon]